MGLGVVARQYVQMWQNTNKLFGYALMVTDDNWMALAVLGHERLKSGDLPTAERLLRRAVELAPVDATSVFELGEIYRMTNRPKEAIGLYRRVLELKPNHPWAAVRLREVKSPG